MTFHVPNKFRIKTGYLASDDSFGNNGAFEANLKRGQSVFIIASDGAGWEHVSVSRQDRCPTWDEMCQVKDLFWDKEDCIIQYHPPHSVYVDNHKFCLHLWRPIGIQVPIPETILVGVNM